MRIMKINEVPALEAGETVPSLRGTLTKVYGRNAGTTSQGKAWAIQNMVLKDDTGEIKLMVKDREGAIPETWKGRQVVVSCKHGDKGLSGLKAEDDTYKGTTTRIVKVTPSASIELMDGAPAAQNAPPPAPERPPVSQPAPATPPAPEGEPAAPAPAKAQDGPPPPTGPLTDPVRIGAHRRSRDYYRVMEACHACRAAWDREHIGHAMTDDHFAAMTATIFIQLQRDGVLGV